MTVRNAPDRRGRAERGSLGLLERDSVLETISTVLAATEAGVAGGLLLEGHAGMGKTRLHEATLDDARARGFRIVRAAGAELEGTIAMGVARQLLLSALADLPRARRDELLEDTSPALRALAGAGDAEPELTASSNLALSHALFSVLATVDPGRPALVAIDDLHWCDAPSLEFVMYLLHRLDELPAALVMTRRPGTGEEVGEALDRIAAHERVRVETLQPLGADAVGQLTRSALGDGTNRALIEACRVVTAGNPFYLRELLLALQDEPEMNNERLARHALSLAPDAVTRSLRVRVGRLGPQAGALARAVAILGDDVPVRTAAALAGLEHREAAALADALAAVEVLLAREPLRFVHPLVRRAVERDIPASEQLSRHLDAARLLAAEGADPERVAAHLLAGRAEGDRWVVEQLRDAATAARARGAPRSAVTYLQRALEEPPGGGARAQVLAELGEAEAAAAMPAAADHLAAAVTLSRDPGDRAVLLLERGRALRAQGAHAAAAEAFDAGLEELPAQDAGRSPAQAELHDQLQLGFISTAWLVSSLQRQAAERSARLLEQAEAARARTHGQRLMLAQAAIAAAFAGDPAVDVVALAARAWDGGRLLRHDSVDGVAWMMVTSALGLTGDLERSLEYSAVVLDAARRQGSPLAFATASVIRSLPELWQGQVRAALADLEFARGARRWGWRQYAGAAAANWCLCLIEAAELEQAEAELRRDVHEAQRTDLEDARRCHALAELRLAQGRNGEALEAALRAGESLEPEITVFSFCPWKLVAAEAALAVGERSRARMLAGEALAQAERIDVRHDRIRGMRILALCESDERRLDQLQAAADLAQDGPPRLETIRVLIDLGSALRRANRRVAARGPLERAADRAHAGGAMALYERARTELGATGARPRRDALLAGPASLTVSERRIAELAAGGRSNREIAGMLFVTPKTVEYHLRNVYRKLDVRGRRELPSALSPTGAPPA